MYITCLDMEGVLVPEIWIAFAEASGIPELRRTTRDEPDYDKLMRWRLGICPGPRSSWTSCAPSPRSSSSATPSRSSPCP